MLLWTIQTIIISFIFIFLIHNIIQFLKTTLTVPKIKDLVHSPLQKYETIIKNIYATNAKPLELSDPNIMKNELKNFLKDQLKKTSLENTTDISML
jgi:uncharacterized protein YeeX (DUF496 family)